MSLHGLVLLLVPVFRLLVNLEAFLVQYNQTLTPKGIPKSMFFVVAFFLVSFGRCSPVASCGVTEHSKYVKIRLLSSLPWKNIISTDIWSGKSEQNFLSVKFNFSLGVSASTGPQKA